MQPVLGHLDRGRRQLGDLTPQRLDGLDALRLGERVRARPAPVRPVLDELVDQLGRKQPPVPALMAMLPARLAAGALPARTRRRRWRVLRRRQRRVPRTPVQTTLELHNPGLKPLVRRDQLIEPQQQTHSSLAITVENRLGLKPLHTETFAATPEVPYPPERLRLSLWPRACVPSSLLGMETSLETRSSEDRMGPTRWQSASTERPAESGPLDASYYS